MDYMVSRSKVLQIDCNALDWVYEKGSLIEN